MAKNNSWSREVKLQDSRQQYCRSMERMILLDLMLPKLDGLSVCQQIREFSNVPIVMLTAKGEDMDKILGLEYGADDYITKPFNILEVKARIKAIMRRAARQEPKEERAKVVQVKDLRIDCESRRVFIGDREINLTAKEFDVLELLVFNPNKVYSRENLLNIVWGYEYPGDVRTVDVHIRRLREKIEKNPSEPKNLTLISLCKCKCIRFFLEHCLDIWCILIDQISQLHEQTLVGCIIRIFCCID